MVPCMICAPEYELNTGSPCCRLRCNRGFLFISGMNGNTKGNAQIGKGVVFMWYLWMGIGLVTGATIGLLTGCILNQNRYNELVSAYIMLKEKNEEK